MSAHLAVVLGASSMVAKGLGDDSYFEAHPDGERAVKQKNYRRSVNVSHQVL